jgi:SWI/SNF chromatin-remodeling complex subunit SWI1
MNDGAAVQIQNGGFNDPNAGANMLDPTAFMPNSNALDPAQFQNPQLQQRMQNGVMRNTSPAFNSPVYQTNSVVPSKRPRPREDSLGASPRQAPGMLPNSRSQTPQQGAYPTFPPGNQVPQHNAQQNPNPYSHLQHNTSANASPSPIMANQLRPGGVPQRVSTASPHPFSPGMPQFSQGSPSQSDNGSRVDTPQNVYPQNGFAPGFNPSFAPSGGRVGPPFQGATPNPQLPQMGIQQQAMFAQPQPQPQPQQQQPPPQQQQPQNQQQQRSANLEQQKMMYQMRMQQQQIQNNLLAQQRGPVPPNQSPMGKPPMQAANGQYPQGMRPQQPSSRPANPEQFMTNLNNFMQSRGLTLDPNPQVGDKHIPIIMLYMAVTKSGGYRRVTQQNMWPHIAAALQCSPQHNPQAPAIIRAHYERNLLTFEEAFASQQQQRQKAMQGAALGMGVSQPHMSPTKPMNVQNPMQQGHPFMPGQQHSPGQMISPQQPLQPPGPSTPAKQMNAMNSMQHMNGFPGTQTPQAMQPPQAVSQMHPRSNQSRSTDSLPLQNGQAFPTPSAASVKRPSATPHEPSADPVATIDTQTTLPEFKRNEVWTPFSRVLNTWGGVDFSNSIDKLVNDLIILKPNVPAIAEMGVIDMHALTMSLQSGIHAEVRLALDTLTTLSVDRTPIDLTKCDDLVETIIECAEDQVELLAEHAAEVSDVMLVSSYEDVVRGGRMEQEGLQETPAFGSLDYELDRAVERLICITTILRNFSFHDCNQAALADKFVIKFLCVVIRYLGTRNMLLRTQVNTLDFMKDVVTFLSNVAQTVEISGKEQALCLLHFLLAFAPCPPPSLGGPNGLFFTSYEPAVHRYLPCAVDGLAKLLARDEPNRTFYKAIFAVDATATTPFDLLTRTFGLAISPVPAQGRDGQRTYMSAIEARKPLLMQGMLAAEILSSLLPGSEANLAKSWLRSEDGFAQNLRRLAMKLSMEVPVPAPARGPPNAPRDRAGDDDALLQVALSAIAVLRRLVERALQPDEYETPFYHDGIIKSELLLDALLLNKPAQPRPEIIKQLCLYASLDS